MSKLLRYKQGWCSPDAMQKNSWSQLPTHRLSKSKVCLYFHRNPSMELVPSHLCFPTISTAQAVLQTSDLCQIGKMEVGVFPRAFSASGGWVNLSVFHHPAGRCAGTELVTGARLLEGGTPSEEGAVASRETPRLPLYSLPLPPYTHPWALKPPHCHTTLKAPSPP